MSLLSFSPYTLYPARPMGFTHFGARVEKAKLMDWIIRNNWEQFSGKTMTSAKVYDLLVPHWAAAIESKKADRKTLYPSMNRIRIVLKAGNPLVLRQFLQAPDKDAHSIGNPYYITFVTPLPERVAFLKSSRPLKPTAALTAWYLSQLPDSFAGKTMTGRDVWAILSVKKDLKKPEQFKHQKLPGRYDYAKYLKPILLAGLFIMPQSLLALKGRIAKLNRLIHGPLPQYFTFKPKEAFLQDAEKLKALLTKFK